MSDRAIVFGAAGTLGRVIATRLESAGAEVLRASRSASQESNWLHTSSPGWESAVGTQMVTRVVWAQGANASGSILDDPVKDLESLFQANVIYVVDTLQRLIAVEAIGQGARLCILSSVWQNLARDSKLAYVTSKAAVGGLVRSLAADLGPRGIAVNAVLPGVVESPMTRRFVSEEVMARIERETPLGRLASPTDVANVVEWITGPSASGVSGQSLVVDQGWSDIRYV